MRRKQHATVLLYDRMAAIGMTELTCSGPAIQQYSMRIPLGCKSA